MEIHPTDDAILIQFVAYIQMINLCHIILYHVTIDLNGTALVDKPYACLSELMNYHDTKTYGFDENYTIMTIFTETPILDINFGIQYDNSNPCYQLLLINNHYQLTYSNQTIIPITTILAPYDTTYNTCR